VAAPYGNRNAAHGHEWRRALKRALARFESKTVKRGRALDEIAFKLVAKAIRGHHESIREIALRLDGKPFQQVEFTPADDTGPRVVVYIPTDQRDRRPGETFEQYRSRVRRDHGVVDEAEVAKIRDERDHR
jgi:hypothetical protein